MGFISFSNMNVSDRDNDIVITDLLFSHYFTMEKELTNLIKYIPPE